MISSGITQGFFAQLLSEPESNTTNQSWGLEGFARWICDIRRQYSAKRVRKHKQVSTCKLTCISPQDCLVNGIAKHCSRDLIRCKPVPSSGMFLWLQVDLTKHSDYRTNVRETSGNELGPRTNTFQLMRRLFEACLEENVLILQSSIFASQSALPIGFVPESVSDAEDALQAENAAILDKAVFLRACYAGNQEQLETASLRLGKAVANFFGTKQ
jgi:hypothetical protein